MNLLSDWSATDFFKNLCATNKLARSEHFVFTQCSGLEGFEEALQEMQSSVALCCVSDIADGYTELNNTPRTRRVKTVFLAMRHATADGGTITATVLSTKGVSGGLLAVAELSQETLFNNRDKI